MIVSALFFFFSITCIYAGVLTFRQDQSSATALILAGLVLLLKPLAFFLRQFRKKTPVVRAGVVDLQKYRARSRRKSPREKREAREKPPTYH